MTLLTEKIPSSLNSYSHAPAKPAKRAGRQVPQPQDVDDSQDSGCDTAHSLNLQRVAHYGGYNTSSDHPCANHCSEQDRKTYCERLGPSVRQQENVIVQGSRGVVLRLHIAGTPLKVKDGETCQSIRNLTSHTRGHEGPIRVITWLDSKG